MGDVKLQEGPDRFDKVLHEGVHRVAEIREVLHPEVLGDLDMADSGYDLEAKLQSPACRQVIANPR
jgi:hypothetical protein